MIREDHFEKTQTFLNTRCQYLSMFLVIIDSYFLLSGKGTLSYSLGEENEQMNKHPNYYSTNVLPVIKDFIWNLNIVLKVTNFICLILYYKWSFFVRFHFPSTIFYTFILSLAPTDDYRFSTLFILIFQGVLILMYSTNFTSDCIVLSLISFVQNLIVWPMIFYGFDF